MPPTTSHAGGFRSPLLPEQSPAAAPDETGPANPSASASHKRVASVTGAVFNISTSIVGAGIMSMPATLKVMGIVPAFATILIVALLCDISVEFMLRYTTGRAALMSYAGVMGESFGKAGATVLKAFVVLNNFGATIVYLVIIGDVISGMVSPDGTVHWGVLQEWSGGEHWWTGRATALLFILVFLLLPLLVLRRVDSLSYSSALAVLLAVVFVAISCGVALYALCKGQVEKPRLFPDFTMLSSSFELFTAVPVIVLAFTFHFNVHPIRAELNKSSDMTRAVRISLALCSAIYAVVGLSGYLLFGDSTLADVLANFDGSSGIDVLGPFLNGVVRVSYALHLVLVFPLLFFSLRINIDALFFPKASRPLAFEPTRFLALTLALAAAAYVAAIAIPDIWAIFQFYGSTFSVCLSLIFPAAIVLRDHLGISGRKDKFLAAAMIVLAVATSAVAIASNAVSALK